MPRLPHTSARRAAVLAGLLGTVLALLVPFLPVRHDITTLDWPTPTNGTQAVSAPLVAYAPLQFDATIPCSTLRDVNARSDAGVVLATTPPESQYGQLTGLALRARDGQVELFNTGSSIGSRALPAGDCTVRVHADAEGLRADLNGQTWAETSGDQRPQLTGIYSDVDDDVDDTAGLAVHARVDNRFDTSATAVKLAAIVLAVVSFAIAMAALRRMDNTTGRRPRRLTTPRWARLSTRDAAVFAALLAWWLIGAMTSDDGYVLSMLRARESAGYVSNYYRWFANPESPFGWFYEVYAGWVQLSTATPWVRLPALALAIGSWLLISRGMLPRLGPQLRRSAAVGWAAAAVFLAFWLPYNNGLRPEPVVVFFALAAWYAVERAVASQRVTPAAWGLLAAALSTAANPHGLVAVLPFLAAIRPLVRLLRRFAAAHGWWAVIAPVACSGFLVLVLVYLDQTWRSVLDAMALKTRIGPNSHWYEELDRYALLFSPIPDGSLTRRFPVLLILLCLATCAFVIARRTRVNGAAAGPSRRLIAMTALCFVVLALTPTKHTHHFGILAAFGGGLAALTALATSSTVLRSRRNRAAFLSGLMLVVALASTGPNAWWYVSNWGVPWFDKAPSLGGYEASTLFLLLAGIAALVAVIEHVRIDPRAPHAGTRQDRPEQRSRALRLGTAPLSLVCALLVLGELAAFGKAIAEQGGQYSLGADNVQQLVGASCGLSDAVMVEPHPREGVLTPAEQQPTAAAPGSLPPERGPEYLQPAERGFDRSRLPRSEEAVPEEPNWHPPHGFGDDRAPVWGSYAPDGTNTGQLRTPWYGLPAQARNGDRPVALSLAGQESDANRVVLEYGRPTAGGFEILGRSTVREGPPPGWRDYRGDVPERARQATMVRVVATDAALGPEGWVAVSAPRVPRVSTLTEVVGQDPAFVEWPAALVHPCLRQPRLEHGIAELPRYRVSAGTEFRGTGQGWSAPDAGGPFGWLNVATTARELPTYLRGDYERDWGTLYRVQRYVRAAPAETALRIRPETHWGTWSAGPRPEPVQLPGDMPSTEERGDVRGFAEED
ncbi:arabinosyltransferase domain-containing protein [Bounagaea algeriensis]